MRIMTTSRYPEITDELLSAYIDNAVSESERGLIERAVNEDSTISWRLATLRETVHLLRTLPVLQAPRSFVLTSEQAGQPVREPALIPGVVVAKDRTMPETRSSSPSQPRRWTELAEHWRRFWQGGSPIWRNAMATSIAILLLLVVAPAYFRSGMQLQEMSAPKIGADPNAVSFAEAPSVAQVEPAPVILQSEAQPMQEALDAAPATLSEAPIALGPVSDATAAQARVELPAVAMESLPVQATAPSMREPDATAARQSPELLEMPAARSAPLADRYEDPLSFAPSGEESASSGYDAPMGIAAAPPSSAPAPSAPLALENRDGQLPETVSAAAVSVEPEGAAAALEDAAPATDPSIAAAFNEEQGATSEEGAIVTASSPEPAVIATTTYDGNATVVAVDASQPAQPDAVELAELPDSHVSKRVEPPASVAGVTTSLLLVQLLPWLQLGLAAATLAFGLLWWRSRRGA